MTRPMKKRTILRRAGQEGRAVLKLLPLLIFALLFAARFWHADPQAMSGLFQSPPTPAPASPTPPPTKPPTAVPATATAAPTQPPTAAPATATAAPTQPAQPTRPSASTETPPASPTVAATSTPLPSPTVPPTVTPAATGGSERYPEEDTNVIFDFGALFDSVALAVSYGWLCCGICALFVVPLLFVVLWVASARYRKQSQ